MIANRTQISRQTETHFKTPIQIDMAAGQVYRDYIFNDLIFEVPHIGVLYGTVNVHTQIHVIYEPLQEPTDACVRLSAGWEEEIKSADEICRALGLERMGMIISRAENECTITTNELLLIATLCPTTQPAFLFLVLSVGESGDASVEAFEVTRPFFELVRTSSLSTTVKASVTHCSKELYVDRSYTHEIDNDYFILPMGIDSFEGYLSVLFPVENRKKKLTSDDLKSFLLQHRQLPLLLTLSDFHVLLYISKLIGIETATEIAILVSQRQNIPDGYEMLLHSIVGLEV
jgi:nuclear protein localization protein 4 homolog